ncbi:unnamed protein product [Tetraodon nigroviridis]|uniref:(spotted green pufferfish) hypothetical protein n=1 Tax=Tetraodon nigroviridis TaxID=99883 RepID=Q4SMN9_TETNG|nr:unnamed protein product [Tetraodon nigroviridis]
MDQKQTPELWEWTTAPFLTNQSHDPPPPPSPFNLLTLPSLSSGLGWHQMGEEAKPLSETGDAMGEEQPDSPEVECQPFPQETWSISNQGALDRPVSTHAQNCQQNIPRQPVGQTNKI